VTDDSTHFGFRSVSSRKKNELVNAVFKSVSGKYDVMNDVMSVGLHRLWKRFAIDLLAPRAGEHILDLAGGTGDLTRLIVNRVDGDGHFILADINSEMLSRGREQLLDRGIAQAQFVRANAESLPFAKSSLDAVIIGFGLRNVSDKARALRSMFGVLKPGGRALILEFSRLRMPQLQGFYDTYSFKFIPAVGKLIANDRDSYEYLVESIRMHPDQEALKALMIDAGFERVDYHNLAAGVVAIHKGYRL